MAPITHATIYCRFSPRPDADASRSNETQEDACREWCETNDYIVAGVYRDSAMSGSTLDRDVLWDALATLKKGSVLVVYRPDRLARDPRIAGVIELEAEKRGARIEYVEGSANGEAPEQELIRGVLHVIAGYERKITAARTRAAFRNKAARGERTSSKPPYGWKVDEATAADPNTPTKLVEVPDEQETIRLTQRWRKEGLGVQRMMYRLTDEGRKPRGEKWHYKTVYNLVKKHCDQ